MDRSFVALAEVWDNARKTLDAHFADYSPSDTLRLALYLYGAPPQTVAASLGATFAPVVDARG